MDLADALRNHARSIKAQKSLGYDPHIVTLIKFKEDTLWLRIYKRKI